jgi:hypothetical protein
MGRRRTLLQVLWLPGLRRVLTRMRDVGSALLLVACGQQLVVQPHQVPEPQAEKAGSQALVQTQYPRLLEMACLSSVAYGTNPLPSGCAAWAQGPGIRTTAHTVQLQDIFGRPYAGSYTTIVDDNRKQQTIVVRGSDDFLDWMTDFRFQPTLDDILQVAVHSGFRLYARAVLADLLRPEIVKELNPAYDTYVAGHSLGGAAAVLVALYLYVGYPNALPHLKGVYTYGQPKVFDNHGATSWPNFAGTIYRVENCYDPVPLVPIGNDLIDSVILDPLSARSESDQYEHIGHEIVLLQPGEYWVPGGNELVRNTVSDVAIALQSVRNGTPTGHDINQVYIPLLQQLAQSGAVPLPSNPAYSFRNACPGAFAKTS